MPADFLDCCDDILSDLSFINSGMVESSMQFVYQEKPCYYVEDIDNWSTPWGWDGTSSYRYLFMIGKDGTAEDPPIGMRSAVPLGGLGAGTIELRADGSLRDWNIFNNSPAGGGQKVHLDYAMFGLRVKKGDSDSRSWILRTHPPAGLPPISKIEYSGAFPVSRLRFYDNDLPLKVDLYAYCEYKIYDPEGSATPAVIFSFYLHNPLTQPVDVSLMFNLPNHIQGNYSFGECLNLSKAGKEPASGTMALRASPESLPVSYMTAKDFKSLWKKFTDNGAFDISEVDDLSADHAGLSTTIALAPKETSLLTFVLSWYFPYRPHKDKVVSNEIVTNYYAKIYKSADDVADKVISRLGSTWDSIRKWQKLCFDNSLPEWLQDSLINSVATMYKTGMWFADGRWRQWESFSCPAVEPVHIHFYRCLPYAFFFPSLQENTLKASANSQMPDGYIQEDVDGGGRMMGDGCTAFIIENYQHYLWTGNKGFLDEIWENVKKAAQWQIDRCEKYGLPNNLNNTYDWWGFENKHLVSYNAFLHLTTMLAAEKLALIKGDDEFAEACQNNFQSSLQTLDKHLWAGEYFRSWWMADQEYPDALHADTLYGQLWAFILGFGNLVDTDKLKSHLESEYRFNESPFGLKVMQGTGGDQNNRDNLVWQAGSLDWCSLGIYLGNDIKRCMNEAEKVVKHWQEKINDQWDYRDLTTAWDGYPWCNSHYARQLIFWSIPLALSGQDYSAIDKRLSFNPRLPLPAKLPFLTPSSCGILEIFRDNRFRLNVVLGRLELNELLIFNTKVAQNICIDELQSNEGVIEP